MASESQLPYRQVNICASLEMTTKWIPAWLRRSASPRRARKPPILPSLTTIYDLFMQNEANFRDGQMNVTSFITSKYEKMDIWWGGKNKANSKPIKANFSVRTVYGHERKINISNYHRPAA